MAEIAIIKYYSVSLAEFSSKMPIKKNISRDRFKNLFKDLPHALKKLWFLAFLFAFWVVQGSLRIFYYKIFFIIILFIALILI